MIPLLGMHRSGTSAVAGALHKLGADLGPESSWLHPAADNPLGFFEYQPVVELNRDVLAALGGTWSSPPPFPPGWVDDDRIREQRERAHQMAAELPSKMIVKDPRLSLVQPLWDVVAPLEPAMVCIRHPGAVAGSLGDRNDLSVEQGLYLWFRYNAASALCRPDALVIEYEHVLEDPETELRRIAAHIGLEVSPTTVTAASSSLHGSMAHHDRPQMPDSPVSDLCNALYDALRSERQLNEQHDVWTWARLANEVPWATPSDQEMARVQRAYERSQQQIDLLETETQKLGQRIHRLETELRHTLATIDGIAINGTADLFDQTTGDVT